MPSSGTQQRAEIGEPFPIEEVTQTIIDDLTVSGIVDDILLVPDGILLLVSRTMAERKQAFLVTVAPATIRAEAF